MARTVTQYRCLLISPGDLLPEREALSDVFQKWNAQIGRHLGINVELVKWESHSVPDLSAPAQHVINQQIVDDCDLGIALFWSRLGTKTESYDSGSIEEIHKLRNAGRRVAVYFKNADLPHDLDISQLAALRNVKDEFRKLGLLGEFKDVFDLKEQVNLYLTNGLTSLLTVDRSENEVIPTSSVATAPKPNIKVKVMNAVGTVAIGGHREIIIYVVENHSSVDVYISQIAIETTINKVVFGMTDIMTGDYFRTVTLHPGQSFRFHTSKESLATAGIDFSLFKYVFAQDQIGRIYEGSEEELARCLRLNQA